MSEKQSPRSLEKKELKLEDYESLKIEILLKLGVHKAALELVSVENAFDDEENPDDPVLCLRLRENGRIKDQEVFKGKDLFAQACKKIAANFRKEGEEWREGSSNLDYYRHVKDKVLLKHGCPATELKQINCTMTFVMSDIKANPGGSPTVNYFYTPGEDPVCEPFRSEEEFEKACETIAGYAVEMNKFKLAAINRNIEHYKSRINERVWTHNPEERPGNHEFDGLMVATIGVREALRDEEIKLLLNYIWKRVLENGGADYFQTFQADDGTRVWAMNQLDRRMKASGEFRKEDNYSTLLLPEEY